MNECCLDLSDHDFFIISGQAQAWFYHHNQNDFNKNNHIYYIFNNHKKSAAFNVSNHTFNDSNDNKNDGGWKWNQIQITNFNYSHYSMDDFKKVS